MVNPCSHCDYRLEHRLSKRSSCPNLKLGRRDQPIGCLLNFWRCGAWSKGKYRPLNGKLRPLKYVKKSLSSSALLDVDVSFINQTNKQLNKNCVDN